MEAKRLWNTPTSESHETNVHYRSRARHDRPNDAKRVERPRVDNGLELVGHQVDERSRDAEHHQVGQHRGQHTGVLTNLRRASESRVE